MMKAPPMSLQYFNKLWWKGALTAHWWGSLCPSTDLDQNQIFHLQWTERRDQTFFFKEKKRF